MLSNKNKFGWRTRYIDAFSGTGTYQPSATKQLENLSLFGELEGNNDPDVNLKDGSAKIAMNVDPPFDRIDLIELDGSHAAKLRELARNQIGERVFVHEMDANEGLTQIARTLSKNERALAFIDPYGCQVSWSTLERIASTGVTDVWYLFPTMGINRQLDANIDDIPPYKEQTLTRVLGTDEWKTAFYGNDEPVTDLFGDPLPRPRNAGPTAVENFFIKRLKTIFPAVHDECLQLRNSRNGHLFSLCFAVSSKSQRAQELALKIAKQNIKRWGK